MNGRNAGKWLLCLTVLAGCSSGASLPDLAPIPVVTTTTTEPDPQTLLIGAVTGATVEGSVLTSVTLGGEVVATVPFVGLDGVPVAGLFTDAEGRLFRLRQTPGGHSHAVAAFVDESLVVTDFLGGVAVAGGALPQAGAVRYDGSYHGVFLGEGDAFDISGRIAIEAEFGDDTFVAQISDRDIAATDTEEFILGVVLLTGIEGLETDQTFAGTISPGGTLQGGSTPASANGSLGGALDTTGVVGVVELRHPDARALGVDLFEVGTFTATP